NTRRRADRTAAARRSSIPRHGGLRKTRKPYRRRRSPCATGTTCTNLSTSSFSRASKRREEALGWVGESHCSDFRRPAETRTGKNRPSRTLNPPLPPERDRRMSLTIGTRALGAIARNAMLDRGLEPDFPADALKQLAAVAGPAHESDGSIRDLRSLLWCSIDN